MIRSVLFCLGSLFCFSALISQTPTNDELIFESHDIIPYKAKPSEQLDSFDIRKLDYGMSIVERIDGKYGFMNDSGVLVVPIEYDKIYYPSPIQENRIIVGKNDYYGVINFKNEVIIPLKFKGVGAVRKVHGQAAYMLKMNSKYGIVDFNGNPIIPLEYESIDYVYGAVLKPEMGYYIVSKNGDHGIFNNKGEILLEPIYDSVVQINGSYFIYESPNDSNIFEADSKKKLLTGVYDKLSYFKEKKKLIATQQSKVGLIDFSDNILIPFDYDNIEFQEVSHLFKITKNGKFGIYDILQGGEIIPPKYQEIKYNNTGVFVIKKDNKYGIYYFHKNGLKPLLSTDYDLIEKSNINYNEFLVYKDKKVGIYNVDAKKMILPLVYDKIGNFLYLKEYASYYAKKSDKFLLLSKFTHEKLIDKEYDRIGSRNIFIVGISNDKYDLLSDRGYQYQEELEDFEIIVIGLVKIKNNGKWGIYNATLKEIVIPCQYEQISYNGGIVQVGDEKYRISSPHSKLVKID